MKWRRRVEIEILARKLNAGCKKDAEIRIRNLFVVKNGDRIQSGFAQVKNTPEIRIRSESGFAKNGSHCEEPGSSQ